jgi:hypothetical protein
VLNRRGVSRAVVLLSIIALALIIAIAIPIVQNKSESVARDVDDLYVQQAEDDAFIRWIQDNTAFTALYDSENKRFVDVGTGMDQVPAYGTSKEHKGQIVFVRVDESGNIYTKWVYPEDYLSPVSY